MPTYPFKKLLGLPLVIQWLGTYLLMQGTCVKSLVREDPTASEQLTPWTTASETMRCGARAPRGRPR